MSISLERHVGLEVVLVEVQDGIDAQGKPTYDSPIELHGRVVRGDEVIKTVQGSEVRSIATVWFGGDQDGPFPKGQDRVTLLDGLTGVVIEREEGRGLRGQLDHVRVRVSPVLLGRQGGQ